MNRSHRGVEVSVTRRLTTFSTLLSLISKGSTATIWLKAIRVNLQGMKSKFVELVQGTGTNTSTLITRGVIPLKMTVNGFGTTSRCANLLNYRGNRLIQLSLRRNPLGGRRRHGTDDSITRTIPGEVEEIQPGCEQTAAVHIPRLRALLPLDCLSLQVGPSNSLAGFRIALAVLSELPLETLDDFPEFISKFVLFDRFEEGGGDLLL